jgi:hypothetical protein
MLNRIDPTVQAWVKVILSAPKPRLGTRYYKNFSLSVSLILNSKGISFATRLYMLRQTHTKETEMQNKNINTH